MTASPFAPFANATLRFQVASGVLVADSKGNMRPGAAVVEVTALLQQKRDPNREPRPGVDSSAVWIEGYITAIANQDSLVLPGVITPDSPCEIVWQGRSGRFLMEFTARNPYLSALAIDLVEKIRGYFQPSSFVVEGEQWTPTDPTPEPTPELNLVRELLAIANNYQTVFGLERTPVSPQLSELYLNGVKASYGDEYVINGSQINWLGVSIATTDELEILYYVEPS